MNKAYYSFVAMLSITATLQDAGITTFKTKRKNIEADIRTSLVDYTYHAKGNTHPTQIQAILQCPFLSDNTQGRRQGGYMTHIGSYTLQTLWRKEQTIVQRVFCIHLLKVQLIGLQEQILVSEYGICQMLQQEVALCILHQRQSSTGLLYLLK